MANDVGAIDAVVTGTQPFKVAHLVSHPIQYFAPLYRELARRPEVDLTVYFCSDASAGSFYDAGFDREIAWDTDLLSGYGWRVPPSGRSRPLAHVALRPQFDLVREIASGRYDILWMHGYSNLTIWLAAAAARASGSALLMREEQTLLDSRPLIRRALKYVALRLLFSQAYGLPIGEQNRHYLEHYGIPPERLVSAPYCVDNAIFQRAAARLAGHRLELRSSFGVTDDSPVALFCGKLVDKKQPLMLLEAFRRVRETTRCWLMFVGDGPLGAVIDMEVERQGIQDVLRAGFLNQGEIAAAYASADVFVLPSKIHETWGLVVNEALNFSLPVVVTDRVGCANDLVRDGWNGFVVPHDDPGRLAEALRTLVADADLRREFGARGRSLVDRYSVEACADGIVAACLAAARPARAAAA